jgi:hypothetical protein
MPNLVYTSSGFPFQQFTKIFSADVNQCFDDIKTVLNGTGTITVDVLKAGTVGQFIGNNGTNAVWVNNPVTAQFNVVLGSASDVTNGQATISSLASWTPASGDRLLILPTYTGTENKTINVSKVYVRGLGAGSRVNGSLTLGALADNFVAEDFRITDNITVSASGAQMMGITFAAGKTWIADTTAIRNSSYFQGMQE